MDKNNNECNTEAMNADSCVHSSLRGGMSLSALTDGVLSDALSGCECMDPKDELDVRDSGKE